MPGSLNLFDGQDLTASSEYSSRNGEHIDTLQIHHATTTSFSGLKSLMDPGGRTVSANGAMANDGWLDEVVPLSQRAFTSASGYDRRCLTVEVCNTTLGPQWGISEACRMRLAVLAVDMFRAGILGGLNRQYIIGHYEVPGTYATACPGPDMRLDHIVWLANQIYSGAITAGGGANPIKEIKVKHIHVEDRRTTVLEPGQNAKSKNASGSPQHVLGAVGPYSITPHVYAQGEPGDVLDITLEWFTAATKRYSPHYTERLVADRDGIIRASVEYKRALADGQSVVLRATAPTTNQGAVTVTVLDCDAFLFTVA